MRNPTLSALTVAIACGLLLAGCGSSSSGGSTDTPATVVTPQTVQELQNARYQLKMVDAVSGAVITDPLTVTFVGTPVLKAADGSSLNGATATTTSGYTFVSADFSAAADDFSVQVADAGSKGWVRSGMRIVGTAGLDADQEVEIRLVNTNQAATVNASAQPVALSVANGSVSSTGALAAAVVATTPPKTVTNAEGQTETIGTASVALPAGTIGKTSTGAPAAPGPLTVANTYFANASTESLSALPGGFAATVQVPAANTGVLNGVAPDAGTFVTAGFAQFNVTDSQGNAIKTFDKPLTLGIDMPKGTLGADGNPVAAGDSYPVWSYDDATGNWNFEKMGTVAEKAPVDPANFTVQFQTTHLSTWALNTYLPSCPMAATLQGRPVNDFRVLKVTFVGPPEQRFSQYTYTSDSKALYGRAPAIKGSVIVTDGTTEVGRLNNQPFCSTPIVVPVTLAPQHFGKVQIETSESCADGSQQRAVPTAERVEYDIVAPGISNAASSYTRKLPTSTDNFASATAIAHVGAVIVRAINPRTGIYITTTDITRGGAASTSAVVEGDTTFFRFHFPMTCQTVTGGF